MVCQKVTAMHNIFQEVNYAKTNPFWHFNCNGMTPLIPYVNDQFERQLAFREKLPTSLEKDEVLVCYTGRRVETITQAV